MRYIQILKNVLSKALPRDSRIRAFAVTTYLAFSGMMKTLYHRNIAKDSIFFRHEDMYMCSLECVGLVQKTVDILRPSSVLDLGCGTGRSLDVFLGLGVDAFGIDGSALAKSLSRHPDRIQIYNLNHEVDLGKQFDLIWCFEVAEHIHPKFVNNLMRSISNHSNHVVISAAPPGQGGEGHYNEQPPSYWIALFQKYGYRHDKSSSKLLQDTGEMFSCNMLVFQRGAIS